MAAPVLLPIHQWSDQNGKPYAAGTISTYIVNTSTPKPTYLDPALSAMNSNPVVLDASGRATMWGDGDFRLVLHDAIGNEIFDVSATTIVSEAMAPVVDAPTIEDAVDLLGIPALIEVETDRAEAAEGALSSAITAETVRAEAAEGALNTAINAETTRAEAEEAHLQSEIDALEAEIAGGSGLFGTVAVVTGSRAVNTVYTNSTGNPMFITLKWSSDTDLPSEYLDTMTFKISGTAIQTEDVYPSGSGPAVFDTWYEMIPSSATYELDSATDSCFVTLWVETH